MRKIKVGLLVTLIFTMFIVNNVFAINFTDLSQEHWAYQYVIPLAESGVINGFDDGTYKPQNTVTRGQFIKLVITATIPSYWDINEVGKNFEHWAAQYVALAEMQGVLELGEVTKDNINEPITRIEMMRWVSKADTIIKESPYELSKKYNFSDVNNITSDDAFLLQHAYSKDYIKGYDDGTFKPEKTMTRAEAAAMIFRLKQ